MSVRRILCGLAAVLLVSLSARAETTWTLARSVERAFSVAAETRAAEAEIGARKGDLTSAGAWPNPTVSVRADEKLGLEDSGSGVDLTQVAITQPLPLGRRAPRVRAAQADVEQAQAALHAQRLALEHRVARAFHALQFAAERLRLAEERQTFAKDLTRRKDRLARYLSPLERSRLAILQEQTHQEVANAEGKFNEALSAYRAVLALPADQSPQPVPLAAVAPPPPLADLLAAVDAHPELTAGRSAIAAGTARVDVARRERLAEPTIQVFRERDFIGGRRQSYNGVIVGVQVPLWGRNQGGVVRARAQVDAARAQAALTRRDLEVQLTQSHAHLGHLIEQAADSRTHLLGPARRLYDQTRRSFLSGEANVLALIDAYNAHFDAQSRYLELLYEGWVTAAELRFATGQSLVAAGGAP